MNETYRTILGLRAIREFRDGPLEQEDLDRVLEAARWTGSAKNLQNWAIIVVRDRDQIERVAACGNGTGPLLAAPVTLVLVQEPGAYELDTGRMAQNIMLAADDLGMATCPITLHRDPDAARVLGLPPGWRCRYAIALGYPDPTARPKTSEAESPSRRSPTRTPSANDRSRREAANVFPTGAWLTVLASRGSVLVYDRNIPKHPEPTGHP